MFRLILAIIWVECYHPSFYLEKKNVVLTVWNNERCDVKWCLVLRCCFMLTAYRHPMVLASSSTWDSLGRRDWSFSSGARHWRRRRESRRRKTPLCQQWQRQLVVKHIWAFSLSWSVIYNRFHAISHMSKLLARLRNGCLKISELSYCVKVHLLVNNVMIVLELSQHTVAASLCMCAFSNKSVNFPN